MDEGTKQKVLIGVIGFVVVLILAINFWPERTSQLSSVDIQSDTIPDVDQVPRREIHIRADDMTGSVSEDKPKRRVDDRGEATIRTVRTHVTDKDVDIPAT